MFSREQKVIKVNFTGQSWYLHTYVKLIHFKNFISLRATLMWCKTNYWCSNTEASLAKYVLTKILQR